MSDGTAQRRRRGLGRGERSVITGAGGGFGRALALDLAHRGATLVLADKQLEHVEETAALCLAAGAAGARALRTDVTRFEEVEALAASATADGPVDLVINNAGVSTGGRVGEASLEDWRWTLDVDLYGVIYGCHAFVPRLRAQGYGHVLNVASAAGLLCAPNMGAYNVAKAGVVALSETMHGEFEGTPLGVTVVCPTFFRTNIVASGRFSDARTAAMAQKLVERGKDAADIARATLESVEQNELYCVPMADGRWMWRLKRAAPDTFRALVRRGGRILDRRARRGP